MVMEIQIISLKCEPPENYVQSNGDCDDSDASISSLTVEVCNGLDDDYDELVDTDDLMGLEFWNCRIFG